MYQLSKWIYTLYSRRQKHCLKSIILCPTFRKVGHKWGFREKLPKSRFQVQIPLRIQVATLSRVIQMTN